MHQETITLIVGVAGIVGTLAGVLLGHRLTTSWQREQWLLDRRNDEYRELLSALTVAWAEHQSLRPSGASVDAESRRGLLESHRAFLRTGLDRLFIHNDMTKLGVVPKFLEASKTFEDDHDLDGYGKRISALLESIVQAALTIKH